MPYGIPNPIVGPIIAAPDTAENLAAYTPAAGEIVYETDTGAFKKGDGTTAVQNLPADVVTPMVRDLNVGGRKIVSDDEVNIEIQPGNYASLVSGLGNTFGAYNMRCFVRGGDNTFGDYIKDCQVDGFENVINGANQCYVSGKGHVVEAGSPYGDFINIHGMHGRAIQPLTDVFGGGKFDTPGDAQVIRTIYRAETFGPYFIDVQITPTPPSSWMYLRFPDESTLACTITIVGRQNTGANHAMYKRMCLLQCTDDTTTLVGGIQTIGTDIETDANWDIEITAVNKQLKLRAKGATDQHVRWAALVEAIQIGYAD